MKHHSEYKDHGWELIWFLSMVLCFAAGGKADAQTAPTQSFKQLRHLGETTLTNPDLAGPFLDDFFVRPQKEFDLAERIAAASASAAAQAVLAVPSATGSPVVTTNPGFSGFNGLTHRDQRLAGTGAYANTNPSLEPPDQGLAVGNGFLLEAVNLALAVRSTDGRLLAGPTNLNQFFKRSPAIIRSNPLVFGDFLSDPKCYFDRPTQRWFVTILEIDIDPVTGDFAEHSELLIAVSQTSDPRGGFQLYSIDVTNTETSDPTGSHQNCPCLGDQPLIGADQHGFYISTNEFPIINAGFNGAQIYAISKQGLIQGRLPTVVHLSGLSFGAAPAFSIQPSTSADLGDGDGNVEFFISTLSFSIAVQNQIAVWALTNTQTLSQPSPSVNLQRVLVGSEAYLIPPDATQKAGPPGSRPLGESIGAPEGMLSTNDHRMQQVVFAQGRLFSALTTSISQGPTCVSGFEPDCKAGVAWFEVEPRLESGALSATMIHQGYVAIAGNFTFFPSVAVNTDGQGLISFSISGPDYFPSLGYVRLAEGATGEIHLAASGVGPDDGVTCYPALDPTSNGSGRWGDYSAAVVDELGNIWFANEYIPAAPRTVNANWGTFIGHKIIGED
jgi:hypothetical protein